MIFKRPTSKNSNLEDENYLLSTIDTIDTSVVKSQTSTKKNEKEGETNMAPLFYFLASSLNVELVYIILKSVTQFVNICPNTREFTGKLGKEVKIIKGD